jgi:nucleoside-diphosphate-sugar epimerase
MFITNYQSSYTGVKIIVLGAGGFLGRWVARLLSASGAQLCLVVRDAASAEAIFAQYAIEGEVHVQDLRDAAQLQQLYQRYRPTITFNLAGYGVDQSERDEALAYQINAELITTLCQAIAAVQDPQWGGQALVHVGSGLEYGPIGGNLAESSVARPNSLYGQSKLAGTLALTQCCQQQGIKGLTARVFTVYGPGEPTTRLLPSLQKTLQTGEPVAMTTGLHQRDFSYVEDVAEGLLRLGLATALPGEIVNFATGRLVTIREFALTAAQVLGIPHEKLAFGALPTRPEEMAHDPVTLQRLQALIGWTPPTTIATGVQKAMQVEQRLRRTL